MAGQDTHCDVLVVGSGAGGLVGAYTAAREGLSVQLIEATDRYGGMTAYSGAGMWFPCNAVLRRAGQDDDMASARAYYRAVVGDRTPAVLQDAYLETGALLIDYLETDPHFAFMVYPWPDYYGAEPHARADGRHIVPEPMPAAAIGALEAVLRPALAQDWSGHPAPEVLIGGPALVGRFLLALSQMPNVTLCTATPLVDFIAAEGAVIGAIVRDADGSERRILARRGTLAAAGGFERNAAMRAEFGVPGEAAGSMAPPGNTGRAIAAAMAIGADVDLMDQAWWSPGLMQPDGSATFTVGIDGGLFVNHEGARFVSETLPYDRVGRAIIAAQAEGRLTLPFWLVYDDRDGGMPPIQYPNLPFADPAVYRQAGLWRSAATLPELAAAIGIPADALVAGVGRFNTYAAKGEDPDFARGAEPYERMFTDGKPPLAPVVRAPFHAAAFGLSDLGTKGGLRTDGHARVLCRQGAPIAGLYATGNSMAAVSGHAYPGGGNPVGSSMVFAYLAARHMVGG
ncbi:FAD-binding protein [Novosphingobium sp.]|uniref:FAD-binding protein n=1 Tax=Novosphingobium sp. TaxID=1874826 RepID=UPI003D1215A3